MRCAGVKLLGEGTSVLPALGVLDDNGVDWIACGTCVNYFELHQKIRVGRVGSMDDVLAEMDRAEKVITLLRFAVRSRPARTQIVGIRPWLM